MKKYILLFCMVFAVNVYSQYFETKRPLKLDSYGMINPSVLLPYDYFSSIGLSRLPYRYGYVDTLTSERVVVSQLGYSASFNAQNIFPLGMATIGTSYMPFYYIYTTNLTSEKITIEQSASFSVQNVFPLGMATVGTSYMPFYYIYSTNSSVEDFYVDDIEMKSTIFDKIGLNLERVIAHINNLTKPLVRICGFGDSILGNSVANNSTGYSSGEFPPKAFIGNFNRVLFDSLSTNKPSFRHESHTDWSYTGTWSEYRPLIYPYSSDSHNKYRESQSDSATASIEVDGAQYVVFLFESIGLSQNLTSYTQTNFVTQDSLGTGKAIFSVSTDGSNYWEPSDSLYDISSDTTYGYFVSAVDTANTYFSDSSPYSSTDYQQNAWYEVGYMLDSSKTYDFTMYWDSLAAPSGPIRLWGCFYWSGQSTIVYNVADPGDSWDDLLSKTYGLIEKPKWDLVLVQSPWWHNIIYYGDEDAHNTSLDNFMERLNTIHKKTGSDFVIMSCPPGGIHPEGTYDGGWTYYPGKNIMQDSVHYSTTIDPLPIEGKILNYKEAWDRWNIRTKRYALKWDHAYIDVYKYFEDYVLSQGDSIASDGWTVPITSDYYSDEGWGADLPGHDYDYTNIKVNVMTRFVSDTDGHHPKTAIFPKWYDCLRDYLFAYIRMYY